MTNPDTIDKIALNKLTKARTAMLIDQPFFGTLAMRLALVQDRATKTLSVDGKVIRYSPDFINKQDNDIVKSAVAHEVMHCVLDHCGPTGRGISLSPKRWNHAADYAANDILKQAGFTLGDGWLWDAQFSNMSAEHIYKLIPEPPPDDGSGNGGPQDEVLPGQKDPAMAAQDASDWKVATVQAANAAKAVGKMSQVLERWVDKVLENKVDWKSELRQFINQVAKDDYAWTKPNRKMQAAGFHLPGLYSETVGAIHVYSDESGSVDNAVMSAFAGEIDAIRQDMRPEKIVLGHFDTRVGKVEEFLPDDEFVMKRYCGGGTDFRPIFTHADKCFPAPMCVIILTDLYGPFPQQSPEYPVLWVTINNQVAPFGATLPIEI